MNSILLLRSNLGFLDDLYRASCRDEVLLNELILFLSKMVVLVCLSFKRIQSAKLQVHAVNILVFLNTRCFAST